MERSEIALIHRHKSWKWSRTYLSCPPPYKSKIVGYRRRALSSIARNKYFSTGFERREFFLENTRGVWHCSSVVTTSFYRTIANIDGFAESSVKLNCKGPVVVASLSWKHACLRTRARSRSRSRARATNLSSPVFDNRIGLQRAFAFLRASFLHSYRRSPLRSRRHLEFNQSVYLSYE